MKKNVVIIWWWCAETPDSVTYQKTSKIKKECSKKDMHAEQNFLIKLCVRPSKMYHKNIFQSELPATIVEHWCY